VDGLLAAVLADGVDQSSHVFSREAEPVRAGAASGAGYSESSLRRWTCPQLSPRLLLGDSRGTQPSVEISVRAARAARQCARLVSKMMAVHKD